MIVIILIIDIPSAEGSSKFWITRRFLVLCLTILLGSWLVFHILMRHSSAAWMVIGNIGLRIFRHKFSKVRYFVSYIYSKYSSSLTFENLCQCLSVQDHVCVRIRVFADIPSQRRPFPWKRFNKNGGGCVAAIFAATHER